ncbi:MAG: SAF domain-containing protein [Aeromicrobium sp.]
MDQFLRWVLRHRRLLAATCAGFAVYFALAAVTAEPAGQAVIVARHDIASGTTLRASDVRRTAIPAAVAPDGAAHSIQDVAGRTTSGAMRRGEVLTDRRTITAGRLDGFGDDRVLSVIRVTDPSVLALLRPGDAVDVVAVAGDDSLKAHRVARRAPVVTLPRHRSTFSDGAPVGLAVTPAVALELAERALDSRLSVVVANGS